MDQGRSFDAACQALFVKLPISARRALAKQAERWTTESIAERLPAVRLASARVGTRPSLLTFWRRAHCGRWRRGVAAGAAECSYKTLEFLHIQLSVIDAGRSNLDCLGALRPFTAKTPVSGYWISLDFLGFSRPKRRLINELRGINRAKVFRVASALASGQRSGRLRGRDHGEAQDLVHGTSLPCFRIFSNRLSSEAFSFRTPQSNRSVLKRREEARSAATSLVFPSDRLRPQRNARLQTGWRGTDPNRDNHPLTLSTFHDGDMEPFSAVRVARPSSRWRNP